MVELPAWFVLSFDWGFSVLELAAIVAAVWSLLDTGRELRQLRLPEARKELGPGLWKRMRIQRHGDMAIGWLTLWALAVFSLIGGVSGVRSGVAFAQEHLADVRVSAVDLPLQFALVSGCVALGATAVVRVRTRIQARAAMREFGRP